MIRYTFTCLVFCIAFFITQDSSAQQYEKSECDSNLFAPNSFCPNCDGLNDVFFVSLYGAQPEEYTLRIFDRWGEIVFETKKPNEGWDAYDQKSKKLVKEDVYVWKVKYAYKAGGEIRNCMGHVTILL